MMNSAQLVEKSVRQDYTDSPSQDYTHPDDCNLATLEIQFSKVVKESDFSILNNTIHLTYLFVKSLSHPLMMLP